MKRFLLILLTLGFLGSLACYLPVDIQCTVDGDCLGGFYCVNSRCGCNKSNKNTTLTQCRNSTTGLPECVDTTSDSKYCGSCKTKCQSAEFCDAGTCVTCDENKGGKVCDGQCANIRTSTKNCGDCTTATKSFKCTIKGQVCQPKANPINDNDVECACPTGFVECSGQCVNPKVNTQYCGGCATACKKAELCLNGKCGACSGAGFKMCGDECPNTNENPKHCTDCNKKCDTNDKPDCCGGCTNKKTDNDNCGGCGVVCSSSESCKDGVCTCKDKNQTSCGGKGCFDLQTSAKNCGICGKSCKSGEICTAGLCCGKKADGFAICGTGTDAVCTKTNANNQHCGACNSPCKGGTVCKGGKCEACSATNKCPSPLICDSGACTCGAGCGWVIGNVAAKTNKISETEGRGIAVDKDGNVYVTGQTKGTAQLDPNRDAHSAGSLDIFVIKYSSDGKVLWSRYIGGTEGSDGGNAIALSSDGTKVYVVGTFAKNAKFTKTGSATISLTSKGGTDAFVMELDAASGKTNHAQRIGGKGPDRGTGLALDGKGNLFVTGVAHFKRGEPVDFPGTTAKDPANVSFSSGKSTAFFAKYDPSTAKFTRAVLLESVGSSSYAITVNPAGSVFITGECDDDFKLSDGSDIVCLGLMVAEFDSSNHLPVNAVSAKGSSVGHGIAWNGKNAVVTGYFEGSVLFEKALNGNGPDVLITSLGNKVFEGSIRGEKEPWDLDPGGTSYSIFQHTKGSYIAGALAGTLDFNGNPVKPISKTSKEDIFVARLAPNGKWDWSITAGSAGEDRALAVAVSKDGGVYVTGYVTGSVTNFTDTKGPATLVVKATKELFVWKIP